jgi:hypothetical protein
LDESLRPWLRAVDKARTLRAFFGRLNKRVLLLGTLLDNFQWRTAARRGEATLAPEHALPVALLNLCNLLPKQAAGDAFQAIQTSTRQPLMENSPTGEHSPRLDIMAP